ncbi:hypothetical protein GUJ93_ZPchr0004g40059 [Zizania palustris]|uniref:DNA-directed RNA polymerase n=1 Tax=Zizania palustris TaxID=103762 RepID=A0A8J5S6W7_ZIZPA|nr:hypothetical protein GUJ93_ZPchr0004g40059 [Zizania palustris]
MGATVSTKERTDGATIQATCKYCSKDGAKLYPSIIFKMLRSPRVALSKSKFHHNISVMDKMSIIAEVAGRVTNTHETLPQDYWDFIPDDNNPRQSNVTKKTLSPYQVFHMLKKLEPELINQVTSRRELLFLSCLPVTPNCHRVAEMPYGHSDGPRLAFDERTKAYKRMVDVSRRIDDYRQHPQFSVFASSVVTSRVMECLKSSKLYSKKTVSESSTDTYGTKWLKDIILSKRSDNAWRSIMVGDPKINLNEIGIPMDLALNLVVSEHVNSYNFESINLKCNLHLLTKEELLVRRNEKLIFVRKANQLEVGDIAYRLLQDGDIVLVNRPPSVHQHSLIALSAKLLPNHFAVSINPLCCDPFKGDFDGDCLHGYIPQALRSRVELEALHYEICPTNCMCWSSTSSNDRDPEGEPGAPVGSWAACAISEAAYGALDHPVNGLEDSSLMKLQEVLKCPKGTNSVNHTGLLFLSKNLRKHRYGFEYASLQVKHHLERVDFSDLVDTIIILYGGCGMEKTNRSPWITHFHLSQETMKIKRLGLRFILKELIDQYSILRKQLDNMIPSVYFSNSKCSVDVECVKNQSCCITMVAEEESNSMSQLDIIEKRVIPSVLATLLKGFLEIKNVKIQCQQDNELVVKVGMSEHCKSGKFWATLQNACIPIMELIDWERSQPDSVYDIFCSYGIDSAWKFFVESLRSTTDDIGRNIRREHLLVVADCLSVSGQFHGLSSQGLKQQRAWLSISSPFSEACFSRPAPSFINSAKRHSVDNLCGTLDAIAWGKEPCTGTSGPFKIIYSGKSHETKQNENIYNFLRNPEVQAFERNSMDTCRQRTENFFKQRSTLSFEGNAGHTMSVNQKLLDAKVGIWDNIIDMRACLQNMLQEYTLNEVVNEQDKACLIEALKFHHRKYDKIGAGIREIKIGVNPCHPDTRCFVILRNDDTTEDFSYKKCTGESFQCFKNKKLSDAVGG